MNLEIVAAILTLGILKKGSSTCECIELFRTVLDLLAADERERRVALAATLELRQ